MKKNIFLMMGLAVSLQAHGEGCQDFTPKSLFRDIAISQINDYERNGEPVHEFDLSDFKNLMNEGKFFPVTGSLRTGMLGIQNGIRETYLKEGREKILDFDNIHKAFSKNPEIDVWKKSPGGVYEFNAEALRSLNEKTLNTLKKINKIDPDLYASLAPKIVTSDLPSSEGFDGGCRADIYFGEEKMASYDFCKGCFRDLSRIKKK